MTTTTTVLECKAPAPPRPDQCSRCQGQLVDERYCARCIEPPLCSDCGSSHYEDEMMCTSCAQRYGLRTVRKLVEWRVLLGQLDRAAGAAVLEVIEMAEERLP